ncbi:hypothetical protein H8959_001386 [Pygathrix nigripes]
MERHASDGPRHWLAGFRTKALGQPPSGRNPPSRSPGTQFPLVPPPVPSSSPISVLQVLVMGMVSWEPGSSPRPTHSQGSPGPKVLGMVSQTQGTKCSGVGETTAQGLGGNDQSLLQGMGQKLWCTPKQELQPLKEMVGNEPSGSRAKSNRGQGIPVPVGKGAHASFPPHSAGRGAVGLSLAHPSALGGWLEAWIVRLEVNMLRPGVSQAMGCLDGCAGAIRGGFRELGPGPRSTHSPTEMEGTALLAEGME